MNPLAIVTSLFFMWGFLTVWNDLLIPRFMEAFTLNFFQGMLVQFAFFGAYAVGSAIYYLISKASGDPINRIGYKNGIIIGLVLAAVGSALFFPAAALVSYPFFLVALFIVGLGFAMLQIAANPYVTILGPEATASSRLNLAQGFNSLGTTLGPIIGGWLIFRVFTHPGQPGAAAVKIPYLCFAGLFLVLAALIKSANLPSFTNHDRIAQDDTALKHPHLVFGIGAIFMYVGGEVTIGSSLVNYLGSPKLGGLSHEAASPFLAYFWGGLMIGRFMGSLMLSQLRGWRKPALVVAVPGLAFLTIWILAGLPSALHYGVFLLLLIVAFFIGGTSAQRMLALFGSIIIALLALSILSSGAVALWSILGIGLFCSIMWSNIFSLAIEGLGALKSQGSSLLVMAILGGAILPPIQGAIADHIGIQVSYFVPMISFAYIIFYGLYGCRAGRRGAPAQG